MGIVARTSFVLLVAAGACADTNNLTGGEELPTQDAGGNVPKKDSGGGVIDDGGAIVPPTKRCDPLNPFGAPTLVNEFDPESNTTKSAVLTPDELEVFYLRYTGSGGVWDLRHARRTAKDAPWGSVMTDAITPGPQGFLSITAKGKKLYYWTNGQNWRAGRSTTADTFGSPAQYSSPNAAWSFIVDADDTVYFSKFADGSIADRYIARAAFDSGGYSGGTEVPNVHMTGYSDQRPVLNESETIMYFGSNRPGGKGLDDVWVARRASKQEQFGQAAHVLQLATDDPDYVTWVSDDDCVVYLDRASHIYVAMKPL